MGVFGSQVKLADGRVVKADEAYVKPSPQPKTRRRPPSLPSRPRAHAFCSSSSRCELRRPASACFGEPTEDGGCIGVMGSVSKDCGARKHDSLGPESLYRRLVVTKRALGGHGAAAPGV